MNHDPRGFLREHAPWLLAEDLGTCVVGSTALAIACDRRGVPGPDAKDLDLSWALDPDAGQKLLEAHGVYRQTTDHNRRRGTLALKVGPERIEITTFRGTPQRAGIRAQIEADMAGRDMTVGALAYWVEQDAIVDPLGGLDDWIGKRVVPVGDPNQRVQEHFIRWIRYYRRAHQWNFALDPRIRSIHLEPSLLAQAPAEAVGAELRSALLDCSSPGQFLLELHECGLLSVIAPELASQFDGRPAGPLRYHPEVGQGLHLILALEWAAKRTADLEERDRAQVLLAVLCHDLGKGLTPEAEWPAHRGHEDAGIEPLRALMDRLPGLSDAASRRLAETVCRLHLMIHKFDALEPGTRAEIYDRYFRDGHVDARLFALAVGADHGGRLGREEEGEATARRVEAAIGWLRERGASVDAGKLWGEFGGDREGFRAALHQARCRAMDSG